MVKRRVAVGQVHVRSHEHRVVVVLRRNELEVELLAGRGVERAGLPELRHRLLRRHVVARGQDDEGQLVALLRSEPVEAVLVGLGNQVAVRYEHVGNALSVAVDDALDGHALLVGNDGRGREEEFGRAELLGLLAAAQREGALTLGDALGNDEGDRLVVHLAGRDFMRAAGLVEHQHVGHAESLAADDGGSSPRGRHRLVEFDVDDQLDGQRRGAEYLVVVAAEQDELVGVSVLNLVGEREGQKVRRGDLGCCLEVGLGAEHHLVARFEALAFDGDLHALEHIHRCVDYHVGYQSPLVHIDGVAAVLASRDAKQRTRQRQNGK